MNDVTSPSCRTGSVSIFLGYSMTDKHEYIIAKQICCTEDTQWAARMAHCEDASHTGAATAATVAECIGSWCPSITGKMIYSDNLDGVVRLTHGIRPFIPRAEAVAYLGSPDDYISDHNGINIMVDAQRENREEARFNIISHNMEGICYRLEDHKRSRYEYVMSHLTNYFESHIMDGTILLLQEVALQLNKKNLGVQRDILRQNMHDILDRLLPLNSNLQAIDDSYTGALIYDAVVWKLVNELKIARAGSNKFSNAYLMQFRRYPDLHIWFVNIHLKAYGGGISTQTQINNSHIKELTNILDTVIQNNPDQYPVYLCGDFNNGSIKEKLIISALRKIYKGPIYNKDIVDISGDDSEDEWQIL